MQISHAPGRWVFKGLSVYTDYGAGNRHKVADTRQPLFTRECQEANARLIAAAPDLVALVLDALDDPDVDILGSAWVRDARTAIAKATGG